MTGSGVTTASYRACAAIARREARNFYFAFLLLPRERRRAMCALYAFMRQTDDLADEEKGIGEKRRALEEWRRSLAFALGAGVEPATTSSFGERDEAGGLEARGRAILPAFVDAVATYGIPVEYLWDVIDGVSGDLEAVNFATFAELRRYCYRVASVVGMCCLHVWGYRSEGGEAERLADSCGVALQLTNILRDVREDAARGRVYLPTEDLEKFGVDRGELRAATVSDRLKALLAFEGARAQEFYRRGAPLVKMVSPVGRPVLRTIVGIYRALLDEIAARGYEVLAKRVRVPGWKKASIAFRSLAGSVE
jgi:phytoene synthase